MERECATKFEFQALIFLPATQLLVHHAKWSTMGFYGSYLSHSWCDRYDQIPSLFGIHAHDCPGSMSFQYPTVTGNETTIEGTAPAFTGLVGSLITSFLVNPDVTVTHEVYNIQGVDAGVWFNGTAYLFLAANLNNTEIHVAWADVGLSAVTSNDTSQVQRYFSVTQNTNVTGFNFRPGGIGIYTVTPPT